jgi:hypothetical protein
VSLTLTQAEATLVGPPPTAGAGLVGAALAAAGFVATGASPVAALAPAISAALMACRITPADVTAPADADLARLPAADWPKFLDIASLLLLEQAAGSFVGQAKSIRWEDYQKEVFGPEPLADRREQLKRKWGYGAGRLFPGSVDTGFAQTDRSRTELLWPWGQ